MQFTTSLALLALSSGVFAQSQIDPIAVSVLGVLATAIPPEDIAKATGDPAAFSSELDSSLKAGSTPEWYAALPSDVKSYLPKLYPAETPASTTPVETSTPAPTSVGSTYPVVSDMPTGGNSTVITTVASPTPRPTDGGNTDIPTSTEFTGGAAYPTGMVGAGVAGAIGFLGMLVL